MYNKRVAGVIPHPTQRNKVTFVDGSEPVYADLVVGADGLRSVVRQSLLDDEGDGPRYEYTYTLPYPILSYISIS